jgi:hypothetical protein
MILAGANWRSRGLIFFTQGIQCLSEEVIHVPEVAIQYFFLNQLFQFGFTDFNCHPAGPILTCLRTSV